MYFLVSKAHVCLSQRLWELCLFLSKKHFFLKIKAKPVQKLFTQAFITQYYCTACLQIVHICLYLLFGLLLQSWWDSISYICSYLFIYCALQLQLWPEPLAAVQPDSAAAAVRAVVVAGVLHRGGGAYTEQAGQLRHLRGRGPPYARWQNKFN